MGFWSSLHIMAEKILTSPQKRCDIAFYMSCSRDITRAITSIAFYEGGNLSVLNNNNSDYHNNML